jgi:copper(I)-binding protein
MFDMLLDSVLILRIQKASTRRGDEQMWRKTLAELMAIKVRRWTAAHSTAMNARKQIDRRAVVFGILWLFASSAATCAHAEGPGTIRIQDAWARIAPNHSAIYVYLEIQNRAAVDDEFTSIWTPVAESAVVMKPRWHGLTMTMERVQPLVLKAGATLVMRPGGYQITVTGVTHAVHPGQTVPLELHLRNAGRLEYSVVISNKLLVSRKPH